MAGKKPLVLTNGSIKEIGAGDTVPISNGGTGATTATAALNALLPSQTGNNTKVLGTDGTNTSWVAVSGGGVTTTVYTLTSNFANPFNSFSQVSNLSFSVTSNKKYIIKFLGDFTSISSGNGCKLGVYLVAGAGSIKGVMSGAVTSAIGASEEKILIKSIDTTMGVPSSSITISNVNATNVPHFLEADLIFTCTTSGTFSFCFASEVNLGGSTLNSGSSIVVTEV